MKLIIALLILWVTAVGVMAFNGRVFHIAAEGEHPQPATPETESAGNPPDIGGPLYANPTPAASVPALGPRHPGVVVDPVIVRDCHLVVIDKQDVPSQHDGVLLVIGTPVEEGEMVPADRLVTVKMGGEVKQFRRLKEDDPVRPGQVLAQLDDRMARDDWAIKKGKITAAKSDLAAAEKTRDEAKNRYDTELLLQHSGPGITSAQDIRGAKLAWERYTCEAVKAKEAVSLAELEMNQAQTVLEMHLIRSTLPGVIKTIYKKPGEAVKSYEPVFQIENYAHLQAEGLVDVQNLSRLHKGMRAVIQPSQARSPEQTLIGHLQEITGVAVSNDPSVPAIVSASEDGTVRVWDRSTRRECRVLRHPAAVRAIACTPPGARANGCLSGSADGIARFWDLSSTSLEPLHELKGQHHGALTCVAISPDGNFGATGGDDNNICLWDLAAGELRYKLPAGHRGAVTSLQFTPQSQLVSAGCDNTLRLWTLGQKGGRLEVTMDRRSGDVTSLGVSGDGKHALFDQGKELRLLSLPDCLTEDVLPASSGATNFTTLAQFSPDARLILTAGAAEGRLQVWRAPTDRTPGYEWCQLVSPQRSPATCAAFAPDGSFLATGIRDRQVLVWPVPTREETEQQLSAEVTLLEPSVESTAGQVRIRAEFPNPDGRLLPGTTVTMMIYPGP